VRADFEVDTPISDAVKERVSSELMNGPDRCDALIVSDYGKGMIQPDYLSEIIALWRREGKWVLIDPHVGHFPWYRRAGMVTPNLKEAASCYGDTASDEASISHLGFRMKRDLELEALLITRGEAGMTLFFGEKELLHVPAVATEVFDVTGAGDTVISMLGALLGAGLDLGDAVAIANRAAGEVVKEVGTSTVGADRIISSFL
jgi:D-beta-D-heptose 7-phosphate kinase/D-beta-D-heptose 1-phosphate adenosyltransferase